MRRATVVRQAADSMAFHSEQRQRFGSDFSLANKNHINTNVWRARSLLMPWRTGWQWRVTGIGGCEWELMGFRLDRKLYPTKRAAAAAA